MDGFIIIEFDLSLRQFKRLAMDDFVINSEDTNKVYWIHCNLTHIASFNQIAEKLKFPENFIELCQQEDPLPQYIDTGDALTIQAQCLLSNKLDKNNEINFGNLVFYLTRRYCFTALPETTSLVSEFMESSDEAMRFAKTPCFILFLMLDIIVNDYSKVLFDFEMLSDQMDIGVRKTHKNSYDEVMDLKQQVTKIKRHMISVREILMRISSRKISVISEECRLSLSNLANHTHMIVNEADSIREMLNGLLDQIDNTLMQKMNDTMRVLTAFAAIFLPLTLITGIYGMNFHWMPELGWRYGYFFCLFLIAFCGSILFWFFKRKKWF